MTTVLSHKDLRKCICAGAGDERLRRVEGHVMDGLVVLLPVGRDLLHARPVVQHPQAHRAVVACRGQRAGGRAHTHGGKRSMSSTFLCQL